MTSSTDHRTGSDTSTPGWIALDLDGTLARYDARHGIDVIGKPIAPTMERLKHWLESGIEVRIFTARAADPALLPPIYKWLHENGLPPLAITNRRDSHILQLWDDRVVQVERNSGEVLTPKQYISPNIHGWIGVALDGTLAHDENNPQALAIGAPVEKMLMRVQQWLKMDIDVRLFTARADVPAMLPVMEAWLKEHGLEKMKVTCEKDFAMAQFWDDRGVHVVSNTGEVAARFQPVFPSQPHG